jgi:hypothetical protein
MPDDHPGAVKVMLTYFYTQNYEAARSCHQTLDVESDVPLLDAHTYSVAHKYDAAPLEELVKQGFSNWASKVWNSEEFPRVVLEIWHSDKYEDLYEVIGEVIADHVDTFLAMQGGALILMGMASGRLSLAFLRGVVEIKTVFRYWLYIDSTLHLLGSTNFSSILPKLRNKVAVTCLNQKIEKKN